MSVGMLILFGLLNELVDERITGMPKIAKHVERICFHCRYYTIQIPGGAYCEKHEKLFPRKKIYERQGNPKASGLAPGERACNFWKG